MRRIDYPLGILLVLLYCQAASGQQDSPRVDPAGTPGSILFSGTDLADEVIQRFVKLSSDTESRIVVLYEGDDPKILETSNRVFNEWHRVSGTELHVIRLKDRDDKSLESVVRTIDNATGVWIVGDSLDKLHVGMASEELRKALHDLLKRDGAIGVSGVHPALVSGNQQTMPEDEQFAASSLNLFPNVVIDTVSASTDGDANITTLLADHPDLVGIELEPDAGLIVRGRLISAIGDGAVRVQLAESPNKPAQAFEMKDQKTQMDLVGLRKAAFDRVGEKFPPDEPRDPFVPNGTLIIIGGGGMPAGIIDRFLDLAGGEDASIVVLPTAMGDPLPPNDRMADAFRRAGAKDVHVLTGRTLDVVESREYLEIFSNATGIWFGGGRQWRFADAYYGTKVHPLMHDVLARGGVIMGSSAGASIQAEYLARATPINNVDIMADGYERGMGFLPGTAVDQHFAQRRRFDDMSSLVARYPQLLGIGIDEATALVVTEGQGEITGRGAVHFFDAGKPQSEAGKDYESVYTKGLYDLVNRTVLNPGEPPKNEPAGNTGRATRPPRPPVTQKERVGRYARSIMSRYDKNDDGLLDEQETAEINGATAEADADEDGKISLTELEAFLAKQFEGRGN